MTLKNVTEEYISLDENLKEKAIFYHFGVAVYHTQIVEEQAMINLVVKKQKAKNSLNSEDIKNLWNKHELGKIPLGVYINEIIKKFAEFLNETQKETLIDYVKRRNYICHDYFRLHSDLLYLNGGGQKIIKDFWKFTELSKQVNELLEQVYESSTDTKINDEKFQEKVIEEINTLKSKEIKKTYKTFIK